MRTREAYLSGYLVPSHLKLAIIVLLVKNKPFPELVVICPDYALRTSLGPFSILLIVRIDMPTEDAYTTEHLNPRTWSIYDLHTFYYSDQSFQNLSCFPDFIEISVNTSICIITQRWWWWWNGFVALRHILRYFRYMYICKSTSITHRTSWWHQFASARSQCTRLFLLWLRSNLWRHLEVCQSWSTSICSRYHLSLCLSREIVQALQESGMTRMRFILSYSFIQFPKYFCNK